MMRGVGGVRKSTPELIGQINNFMDKDRRVSIEVRVGSIHTVIREELKMQKICAKFVQRVLREDEKKRCCHDCRAALINPDLVVFDALVTCDESWIYSLPRDQETEFPVEACWLSHEGQT